MLFRDSPAIDQTLLSPLPRCLTSIPQPPRQIFQTGESLNNLLKRPRAAIVGSRKATPYGKLITTNLAATLAKHGVVIVSGLAVGIDSIAHQATLEVGGQAIAVLPCPLDNIVPRQNRQLAQQIISQGGCLLSEYPSQTPLHKYFFVERNRLVAALADVIIITEAAEKSGSLHTAAFALDQGKAVLAAPGSIIAPSSSGTNNLLKDQAAPLLTPQDALDILGIYSKVTKLVPVGDTQAESTLLKLVAEGVTDGAALFQASKLPVALYNQTLTMLEIQGKIKALGLNQWALE